MEAATLLLVLLSGQGYWLSGAAGEIEIRWAVEPGLPGMVLQWELRHGRVVLADGEKALHAAEETRIALEPPAVRTRVELQWRYRVVRHADGAVIASGSEPIHLFPDDLLSGTGRALRQKRVVVWDTQDEWRSLLERLEIPFQAVDRAAQLQTVVADIVIVASEQLDASAATQATLLQHAAAGASILIMSQTQPSSVAGYPLSLRARPADLEWRGEHVLFAGLDESDRRSWLEPIKHLRAIQLPADEPALELAWWPAEAPGKQPAPIDALVVTRQIGTGRVVLWQIPLGDWRADPRTQLFAVNALEYLSTRPEPTPPPSQRVRDGVIDRSAQVRTITIPAGDRP